MCYLTERISKILKNSKFADSLRLTDNQFALLPLILKFFEQVIFDQLCNYMSKFLNNLLCGFSKVNSTQDALFRLGVLNTTYLCYKRVC